MTDLTHQEISRKGGNATAAKYGKEYYSRIAKKAGQTVLQKYGIDYYKNLNKKSVAARRQRKEEAKKASVEV